MLGQNAIIAFGDFVKLCLKKDSFERPTAEELLRHRFIRRAKKTSHLTELIDRVKRWRLYVQCSESSDDECYAPNNKDCDDWSFDDTPDTVVSSNTPVSAPKIENPSPGAFQGPDSKG